PPAPDPGSTDAVPTASRQSETNRRRKAFDREWDAAHHGRGELDDQSRHRLEIDSRTLQSIGHLAAVGERVRVAWKKDGDLASIARKADHIINRFERRDVRVGGGEMQQARAASVADANDVGFFDCFHGLNGGQPWMTWSDADEPDPTHATTMPIPTRDTGDRLELSAHHVVRQRDERR